MRKSGSSFKSTFAARFLLLLCSLVVSLLAVEYAGRLFLDTRSPFEQRFPVEKYRAPFPYVMFSGQPGAPELNELGYRGPAPTKQKSEGEFRIIMLGGSTMVHGAPTIAELLETQFRKAGRSNVKVYNFGVVSSVSAMEAVKILTEVSEFKPDLVIMYNGGNDIIQPYTWDPRPGYPFNFVMNESNLLGRNVEEYPLFTLMAFGSAVLRKVFYDHFVEALTPISGLRSQVGYQTGEWENDIAYHYAQNIRKARTISNAFGAGFCVFFQPIVFYKKSLTQAETMFTTDTTFKHHCERQRELFKQNKLSLSSEGVMVYDISDVFDNTSDSVFVDYIHVTQDGNKVVAQAMFAPVLQLVEDLEKQRAKRS